MDDDKALIAELTQLALQRAAPDELAVFDETAQEYFADPQAALNAAGKNAAVGFGLELAMLTPAALAVGSVVLQALAGVLAERTVSSALRRVFRKRKREPADLALSPDQARYVRQVALHRALSLGLPEEQAVLLADSFVGAMVTSP